MSERTAADEIADVFAEARPTFAENFHADRYELVAVTSEPDGRGGWTEVEAVIESGRGALAVAGLSGQVRQGGVQLIADSPYECELPYDTQADTTHTLRINGDRRFAIDSVRRGGEQDLFTVAALKETT